MSPEATKFSHVTHVIFDMDGLLLDTESLYTQAIDTFVRQYGKNFTWECKRQQMGRKPLEAAEFIINYLQLPCTPVEYMNAIDLAMRRLICDGVPLLNGVEKLIRHFHKHGIPMALCTGSSHELYQLKARKHPEIFSLLHHLVFCADDVDVIGGKPHPDCYLVTAGRFAEKPEPRKVLVFEDAQNGVSAALAAGMQVVMVPDKFAQVDATDATLLLNSLENFEPDLFGLPKFT